MSESMDNLIKIGDYVIIKKENYKKVHKVSKSSVLKLGKDEIETKFLVGKSFWTTFEIVASRKDQKFRTLEPVIKAETLDKIKLDSLKSGFDNRLINDNGTSQLLSKEEILDLRKAGKSAKEIVQTLVENSTSFSAKTEYSQEKYIRKKGKKYFQYLTVCRPTIELLQEIYFQQDYIKINSVRVDTLAQILSYSDVKSNGIYLLYDSGSLGLTAASMLNRIGANTTGCLINLFPENEPQTTIIKAMNFPEEQLKRLTNISIQKFIKSQESIQNLTLDINEGCSLGEVPNFKISRTCVLDSNLLKIDSSDTSVKDYSRKRKNLTPSDLDMNAEYCICEKKSKMFSTLDLLKNEKAEGLVIMSKEHPLNIIESLISFVKKSRPFVIFNLNREPLQDTYLVLKQKYHVINLKLYTCFLRSYQVLIDRTHPDIATTSLSGYLLTGYLVH